MPKVTVCDGKYTIIWEEGVPLRALRYDEEWRDLTGDGLVLALAQELIDYKDAAASEAEAVNRLTDEKRALLREVAELRAARAVTSWISGFLAATHLFNGRYEEYAVLRDAYLNAKKEREQCAH